MERVAWGVVGMVGGAAATLTVRSLGWPLVHDGPLMHYVAARILGGAAPYRDLFDMNLPGVYLAHMLALVVLGRGDGGFRAFDLVILGATLAGLAVALRSFGWLASASGAGLFWLYHAAGGAWRAGQRDLLLCLPLAWMTAAAVAHVRRPRPGALGLAGLGLGAAVWIKPHALLFLPALAALAWVGPARRRGPAVAALAAGLAAPALLAVGWLAATGGLAAFLDIVTGYLVPLYSRLGRAPLLAAVLGHDLGPPVLAGLGLWAALGLLALGRAGALDGRAAVLGAGLLYGALHFAVQGKGWEYHLYPLALFAIALGAAGLGVALGAGRVWPMLTLAAVLLLVAGTLWAQGLRALDPPWIAEKRARGQAVAAALAPRLSAGDTVQVLDTTEGGIDALYRLGARQPTRFLYDFPFYHDVDHPYIQGLRRELLAGLRARPPAAVVLFERGWPRGGYDRLEAFPALWAWLDDGYVVTHQGAGFRVYAARHDR